MPQPTPQAPIRCSQWSYRNFLSPATDGRGEHPATPTISPPPEYTSREGSSPRSDQDSIEAVTSSNASSCEKHPSENEWDGKPDKKLADEKPTEKSVKPKKLKKQSAGNEPLGVQIWLTILQLPRKDNRVWLVVGFLIVLICVLVPILWIDAYRAGSYGAIANATSTVTVANSEPTITTVVTKTPATSVLTIISTSTVSKSHIPTTTATIPSPVPTRIGGFAAIEYEDEWTGDLSVSLFWVDDHGDIKQLDSDSTTASGWNDAGKFTSHARVGSAVCHVYASDSNYEALFFVGDDYIIQDYYYDYGWEKGTLSSLGLKTSESMNFMACAPSTTTTDETNNLAGIYVFYNSTNGHIRVAELSNGLWVSSPDTPFSVSAAFVGCDSDYCGNLLAYVVNDHGQLEQWSLKKDLASPWTLDLQHGGPYNPRTLIYSVTASKNSEGRSHIFLQNLENTIIRLDTHGLGTNTKVVGKADIAGAVAGTRMTASGDCNSTVTLYYQANSTEMREYSMVDDALNNAVVVLRTGPVQSGLPFGSGAGNLVTSLNMRLIWCLIYMFCLFC